ncbi:hypothetical protein ARMGADRAFT_1040252 [Armillaria gallica]|uniref:Uncharacterized protein n=1 Tax=Armillaria gallica TaxID=47427 RepID=A0A2H3CVN2_ARMGA|nr:hypothetical protein ARMGADRAFT_1040252 [Armillaria gallica]
MVTEVEDEYNAAYTRSPACGKDTLDSTKMPQLGLLVLREIRLSTAQFYFNHKSNATQQWKDGQPLFSKCLPIAALFCSAIRALLLEEQISDTNGSCGHGLAASEGPLASPSALLTPPNAASWIFCSRCPCAGLKINRSVLEVSRLYIDMYNWHVDVKEFTMSVSSPSAVLQKECQGLCPK